MPHEPARRFHQLARVSAFRLGWLEERVLQALDTLHTAGIRPVLLKGAALAVQCYDGFAERPMLDADILVPGSDAHRAWELLAGCGWSAEVSPREVDICKSHHHLPPLIDPATGVAFEIHTRLAPGFDSTNPRARRRPPRRPARPPGRTRRTRPRHTPHPPPPAIHFAWSHGLAWAGWRTFRDVHAIIDRLEVDWETVLAADSSARASTCLYWTLRLARTLTALDVDDDLLRPPPACPTPSPPLASLLTRTNERVCRTS